MGLLRFVKQTTHTTLLSRLLPLFLFNFFCGLLMAETIESWLHMSCYRKLGILHYCNLCVDHDFSWSALGSVHDSWIVKTCSSSSLDSPMSCASLSDIFDGKSSINLNKVVRPKCVCLHRVNVANGLVVVPAEYVGFWKYSRAADLRELTCSSTVMDQVIETSCELVMNPTWFPGSLGVLYKLPILLNPVHSARPVNPPC